jgi:hypothetical protein
MKYSTEMGPGVMIYTPSFMKTGSGIQLLLRGVFKNTQHGNLISLFLFIFLNKENRLIMIIMARN